MRKYLVAALAAALILAGCRAQPAPAPAPPAQQVEPNRPRPPELKVTAGDTAIPVTQGSYCWNEGGQGLCADTFGLADLVAGTAATPVKSGAVIELRFARAPDTVGLSVLAGGQSKKVTLEPGNKVTAPTEPGKYIYMAFGRWSGRGDGSYAFHIEVK